MICDQQERLELFLDCLESFPETDRILTDILDDALRCNVPVIRRGTANLLRTLIAAVRPRRILEIGTAVGYSALWMAVCSCGECRITTIEMDPERIRKAKENFSIHPLGERIRLLEGEASGILTELNHGGEQFDLVFMDAAKGQYPAFLPAVRNLVREGGMIITDNVLREGDILQPHYAVKRRNRTIHKRMRDYLFTLTHDKELATSIIPIGDGVAVTVIQTGKTANGDKVD